MTNKISRTVNKEILLNSQYKTDNNLLIRKRFNSFSDRLTIPDETIIKYIMVNNPESILDVGCGNGDLLIAFRKAGFKGKLVGVDLSAGMLSAGIRETEEKKLDIHFEVADAEQLPFVDNSFSVVIAKHMLYHLPNLQQGLAQMHRCLMSSGTLIITLNSTKNTPMLHEFEAYLAKKYGIRAEHGQSIVSMESIKSQLNAFKIIESIMSEGNI